MKSALRLFAGVMLVATVLFLQVLPAHAMDSEQDRWTISYYHRFAGNGGPPVIDINTQLPPYFYETFIQNKQGVEFGYQTLPTMVIHGKIDHQRESAHDDHVSWTDDTFYPYGQQSIKGDWVSDSWSFTADVMFEPFRASQEGSVRAILGLGPFVSVILINSENKYDVNVDTPEVDHLYHKTTDETIATLIGLRGIIGAEWWIKERIGLVCQTGFEAALFTSTSDQRNNEREDYHPSPITIQEREKYQRNGWLAYSQQVMLGVRVKF